MRLLGPTLIADAGECGGRDGAVAPWRGRRRGGGARDAVAGGVHVDLQSTIFCTGQI
jgi:hypothetical protein